MTKLEKLIAKIWDERGITFDEAEILLKKIGYKMRVAGSHHIFTKANAKGISLKNHRELLPYQIRLLQEALKNEE